MSLRPQRNDSFDIPADCTRGLEYTRVLTSSNRQPEEGKYDVHSALILQEGDKASNAWQVWLWPDRIPIQSLSLLAGDPGVGKSLLTLEMAARLTRGTPWPDCPERHNPPGRVVIVAGEDSIERTIRPRLELAGADLSRVVFVHGIANYCMYNNKRWQRGLLIPDDLPGLTKTLHNYGSCALCIIDPVSVVCRCGNSSDMSAVRQMLRPLEECAEKSESAIVCVTHLNKSSGRNGMHRVMGSLGFTAAARAVWGVTYDPADRDRRLLLPVKCNLGKTPPGLAFRIVEGKIAWEPEPVEMTWDEALEHRRKNARHEETKRVRAGLWLCEQLAGGDRPAADLLEQGRQKDFSERTLRRASKDLDLNTYLDGPVGSGCWRWALKRPELMSEAPAPPGPQTELAASGENE